MVWWMEETYRPESLFLQGANWQLDFSSKHRGCLKESNLLDNTMKMVLKVENTNYWFWLSRVCMVLKKSSMCVLRRGGKPKRNEKILLISCDGPKLHGKGGFIHISPRVFPQSPHMTISWFPFRAVSSSFLVHNLWVVVRALIGHYLIFIALLIVWDNFRDRPMPQLVQQAWVL